MRAHRLLAIPALLLIAIAGSASPAAQTDAGTSGLHLKPAFHFELFSRTLTWDDGTRSSRLLSPQAFVGLDFEITPGFDIGLIGGYSLSNWNGLVFRNLPFSIDNQAGSIGGLIVGAEVRKRLFVSGFWEMDAEARFSAYLGQAASYPITGLAVEGQADLKGNWMRVEVGPVLIYRGFELFSPFLGVAYDRLWGKMTMTETIEDLEGTEEKKVAGAGAFAVSFGTIYEPSTAFRIKIGATLIPFQKIGGGLGLDYGGTVRAGLAF
ncbi:MAG: hypothetical protein NTZ26_06075 [Candidatus Aminicenantes bacterium]|nr:hypothetical protein [Candidatus Aminicenantes bacterium]